MNDARPATLYGTLHTLSAEAPQAGMRLDKWLAECMPEISRSRLKVLIESGRVCLDDAAVTDAGRRLKGTEVCVLDIPVAQPADPEAEAIALDVVYEDDDLIVIDKPAGMVVHPAAGNYSSTLVNALLHHCGGSLSGIGGVRRPGIVHRLDKDTSGLLVAAKTDAAHQGLAEQFAAHSLTRAYRAVCWGVPMPRQGEIEGNIGRSPNNRKKMAIVERGGKPALTRYRVERAYGQTAALVECRLATGRTHQIRVHMTSIGHPLIGDPLYGRQTGRGKGLPAEARDRLTHFPRQALHAFLLGFLHPTTHEHLLFESKIPLDFNKLTSFLEGV
ncbi:RluA family pseudouridine synthase [Telmatospirillum siberiense]|uniref:Pseudouridine synthase n=1 Tax=Telmatospirillum siberiense TaxID=382514 RepID=A0A2N3Q1C2_9PROT|nr:RluA family pseudouridine synthase [Telmatospirillum siberiense]PKU26455.1 RNA pseudouridine synthase [Telmatospirillum siberiense]